MSEDEKKELRERIKCEIIETFYNGKISLREIQEQIQTALRETNREIKSDVENMRKRIR